MKGSAAPISSVLAAFVLLGAARASADPPAPAPVAAPASEPSPQQPPPPYPPPTYPPGYGYGRPAWGYSPPPPARMPATLPYIEGQPVNPGYHVETRIRKGMLIGGLSTFGAGYILSVIIASDSSVRGNEVGLVPVIGPFIAAGTLEHISSGAFLDFDFSGIDRAFFVISGLVQTAGVALTVVSVAAPTKLQVLGESAPMELSFAPVAAPGFAGAAVSGSF